MIDERMDPTVGRFESLKRIECCKVSGLRLGVDQNDDMV